MRTRFVLAVALAAAPSPALAEDWIVAEAPAAMAVSAAQDGLFRSGAMPAGGLYHGHGPIAFGLRMRAGVLRNGPDPGNNFKDPGVGGLASAGLAVRLQLRGLWIEGVAGPGVTGHDVVPAAEAGVGFNVTLGGIDVGPSVRYLRLQTGEDRTVGSADLLLVGLEVQIGRKHERHAEPTEVRPEEPMGPLVQAPPPLVLDRDRDDELAEIEDGCADDGTGCGGDVGDTLATALANGTAEITDDRIVLDERVMFDTNRARVRSAGREMIAAIARMWRAHPEWQKVVIEGHADVRGPDDYNLALSQRRAELARAVLIRLGFDAGRVEAVGYGRSRPRDPGTTDDAHHRNRRVEFVIVRHGATALAPSPSQPSASTESPPSAPTASPAAPSSTTASTASPSASTGTRRRDTSSHSTPSMTAAEITDAAHALTSTHAGSTP